MKIFKIIAFISLIMASSYSFAQPMTNQNKPVQCGNLEAIVTEITGDRFKESLVWVGEDTKSKYVLFTNQKTGTWTFIQFNDKIGCVLGTGESGQMLFKSL